jgi:hypothetical protein
LEIARGGPETRRQQREVLNRLDEIIKKLEAQNKNKKKPGDGPPKPGDGKPGDGNGGECPDGSQPGPGAPGKQGNTNPPQAPGQDVFDPTGSSTGQADPKAFKKLVADWGRLPPREQQKALQDLTQGMSPRHREAIEAYFRSLSNPGFKR